MSAGNPQGWRRDYRLSNTKDHSGSTNLRIKKSADTKASGSSRRRLGHFVDLIGARVTRRIASVAQVGVTALIEQGLETIRRATDSATRNWGRPMASNCTKHMISAFALLSGNNSNDRCRRNIWRKWYGLKEWILACVVRLRGDICDPPRVIISGYRRDL